MQCIVYMTRDWLLRFGRQDEVSLFQRQRRRKDASSNETRALDVCVLAALAHGDSYGYQIIKDVPQTLALSESTLYPILRRLSKQGALREYSKEHNGRLRKYYSLTDEGRQQLQSFAADADQIEDVLNYVREGARR